MTTTTTHAPPATAWPPTSWRRALVYGLGLSGQAASRLLLTAGVSVVAVDQRQVAALELGDLAGREGFEVLAGNDPERLPEAVDGVIVSPGVPPDRPLLAAARAEGLPIVAEVELAFTAIHGPVIGITGTNGKSTTTEMTGALVAAAGLPVEVCGNIGRPISQHVSGPAGRVFVVELSSFQLENLHTFRPRAAALLNLAEDHLDRYSSLAEYGRAKAQIFARMAGDDVVVLNADDPRVVQLAQGVGARRRWFSRRGAVEDGCWLAGGKVLEAVPGEAPGELFKVADVPLAGAHNLENAMAAALLARAVGVEPAVLPAALRAFRGLPHRMVKVRELGGVTYFDDSKGTNMAAAAKSLEGLPDGSVHLILGGRHKGDDPAQLAPLVERKARRVYLIGEAAAAFEAAFAAHAPCEQAETLANAVASASRQARPGESVLLSPACASFDQFKNYAERGDRFQALVAALGEEAHGQEARL